jgi:hypothetical protein
VAGDSLSSFIANFTFTPYLQCRRRRISGPGLVAAGAASSERQRPKRFPKAPPYDFQRPTIAGLRDEAAHRARLRQVGHCFSASLLPDLELVIRGDLAPLLQGLIKCRGKTFDMHHWSRAYALDHGCVRYEIRPTFLILSPYPSLISRALLHFPPRQPYFSTCR